MNKERYQVISKSNHLDFEFESEGPRGRIKKAIIYRPHNVDGITYFNLGFGNWNDDTKEIDDKAISNNLDRDKILVTVAVSVLEFTKGFPDMPVFIEGSTPARTRLYQMGISANMSEIETVLKVYGRQDGEWKPFRKNVNYDAFMAWRKHNT